MSDRATVGPVVLDLAQIQAAVTLPGAVRAVEGAFRALGRGQVTQPPPIGLDLVAGEVHVKSAQLGSGQPGLVKVATGFPGERRSTRHGANYRRRSSAVSRARSQPTCRRISPASRRS